MNNTTMTKLYILEVTSGSLRLGGQRVKRGTHIVADAFESIPWGVGSRDGYAAPFGSDAIGVKRAFIPATAVRLVEERQVEFVS